MYACLYFHGFMLCFMLASTVHNLDCYFTSVYLWLCKLFLLIVNLLLILGFILIMCVYLQLSSFCFFYFCLPFFSTYNYTVLGYVWVCNFPCLHITFLVLLQTFWWWILRLIVWLSVYFTSSSPYHTVFCCFFFCFVGILFYFLLYMLLWLL